MTEHHATHPSRRGARLLVGLVLGLAPGVLLILLAQFAISGEQELTVGTAGMWLAAAGALIGPVAALRSGRTSRTR